MNATNAVGATKGKQSQPDRRHQLNKWQKPLECWSVARTEQENRCCTNQGAGTGELFRRRRARHHTNQTVEGAWWCTVCQGAGSQLGGERDEGYTLSSVYCCNNYTLKYNWKFSFISNNIAMNLNSFTGFLRHVRNNQISRRWLLEKIANQ